MTDKERVAKELEAAAKTLAELLNVQNVELMRPSDILVSVANVLDRAAKNLQT